ncbi:MAG TPA: DUF1203 domain-containing protein [Acetobacteraceae bacterium]|nr:DUF1203 domain-containing protein [Acetobacteraceae bacterium]
MKFRIRALPVEEFQALFGQPDEGLAANGVRRVIADDKGGFPCRVSLRDAAPGESLLLLNYEHLAMPTPYRARHAIYVREGAVEARPAPGEIPQMLCRRLLSVRAYDGEGMMMAADVTEGAELAPVIERMLARQDVAFLHIHNAKPGCYAARVERAK